jgi:hypothetical protein
MNYVSVEELRDTLRLLYSGNMCLKLQDLCQMKYSEDSWWSIYLTYRRLMKEG